MRTCHYCRGIFEPGDNCPARAAFADRPLPCEAREPMKKTIRVRIAVAVGAGGQWSAVGCSGEGSTDDELESYALEGMEDAAVAIHFIEADVPLPETVTVEGRVSK